jgi:tetratricopeptide (TPR) repeat protein
LGKILNQIDFHKLLDETYTHLWNGRNRLALTNSKILFKNYPSNSEAAIILAWALLENGYPIKALEYADLSIQLNGSTTKSKMVRAQILLRLNILDGAIDDFDNSIKSQKKFLGNSYIQYARLEASKGELLKAIKLVEKSLLSDSDLKEEVNNIKELLLLAFELKSSKTQLSAKNLQIYFNKATLALKSKDIWFVNIIANEILNDKSLKEFHGDAELIKLEGLLHSFQFKPAIEMAKSLEEKFKKNKQFKIIYDKIIKKQDAQKSISVELDNEFFEITEKTKPKAAKRIDSVFYDNEKVEFFSLKVFNQHDEINTGKRVYYDQLDYRNLNKAGIEIIFENLQFEKTENEYNARIIWHLDDIELFKNDFKLLVPMDWDTVIFTQFAETKWKQ